MVERRCRYCERVFQPSKYQPAQSVCGDAACRRRRCADYHRQKIATDAEYRQSCLDSPRKWRFRNPDYWRRYREQHPGAVERNRQQQHVRDQKRRLRQLANNNSASNLKPCPAEVWVVADSFGDLANNNSVPAQIWILQALPPRKPPASASCQQQPAGAAALSVG
jgi:hypothetical protein